MSLHQNEIKKCAKSFKYFYKNYVQANVDNTHVPIEKLTKFQEIFIYELEDGNRHIGEKFTRGCGASHIALAKFLHMALFTPNQSYQIFLNGVPHLNETRVNLKIMYDLLPEWLQVSKMLCANKDHTRFENNSVIKFALVKTAAIMGMRLNYVYFDEPAANTQFSRNMWKLIISTISSDCGILLVSTETDNPTFWDKLCKYAACGKINIKYFSD